MLFMIASAFLVGLSGGLGLTFGIMFGVWIGVQAADLCDGMWSPLFSKDARPQ